MDIKHETKLDSSSLLAYLNIAANFRNHEFNIQMLRNVVFTGSQAIFLACYAATIGKYDLSALAIALFGVVLSIIWRSYYKASLYWAWFWEYRCRQINDKFLTTIGLDVDLFAGHPVGTDQKDPPPLKFGGMTVMHSEVHRTLKAVQIFFCVFWLILVIAAGVVIFKAKTSTAILPTAEMSQACD